MSSERPQQVTSATALDQCLNHIRFARATELSRSGNHLEAEALLTPDGRVPASARELDLLARIAAQQERFDDAARYWNAALKTDPDNASYKDCLQELSQIRTGGQPTDTARTPLLWSAIVLCALIVLAGLFLSTHRTPPTNLAQHPGTNTATPATVGGTAPPSAPSTTPVAPATIPTVPAPAQPASTEAPVTPVAESASALHRMEQSIEQARQTQRDQLQSLAAQIAGVQVNHALLLQGQSNTHAGLAVLSQSIADIKGQNAGTQRAIELARSELAALAVARAPATPVPTNFQGSLPSLAAFNPGIPGVTISHHNDTWIIRFEPGLFDRDVHFNIGAKARLQSVAKALVQTQARLKVQIVGVAEDEPPTWPWSHPQPPSELGFQRAQRVAAYLRSLGVFPPDKLTPVSGTPSQRPFQSPNRNNRTVALAVTSE